MSFGLCCGTGRLVYARLKLGLLDPPSSNPYTKIPPSAANSAENRELAARTAREGVVLLTNPKKTLPLVSDRAYEYTPPAFVWLRFFGHLKAEMSLIHPQRAVWRTSTTVLQLETSI